jgi:hypothetical protein
VKLEFKEGFRSTVPRCVKVELDPWSSRWIGPFPAGTFGLHRRRTVLSFGCNSLTLWYIV